MAVSNINKEVILRMLWLYAQYLFEIDKRLIYNASQLFALSGALDVAVGNASTRT